MYNNRLTRRVGLDFSGLAQFETAFKNLSKLVDPFGVITPQVDAHLAWLMHPNELLRATNDWTVDMAGLWTHAMRRSWGLPSTDVFTPHPDDDRFTDHVF